MIGLGIGMVPQLQVLAVVAVAMLLGSVIGLERERANKPAGVRTNMLVCGGSALVVALGSVAFDASGGAGDPTRALHAVITGIGFLGGGAILRDSTSKETSGLTSAASIFFVAALGAACGLGLLLIAAGACVLILAALRGVHYLEDLGELARSRLREDRRAGREDL